PSDVFWQLQSPRDMINQTRVFDTVEGVRTAFFNPYSPTNAVNFVLNYAYAVVRLNLAPLFDFGVRSLYLAAYVGLCVFLVTYGLRSRREEVRLPALLFMAHFLVLAIFEPDLGSYLRH